MNKIIDLIGRFSGLGWVWGKLDGNKTRIAGIAGILSGLAGLVQEFLKVADAKSFAALLEFVKHLPADQSWLMVVGGLATLGLGHKIEKAAALEPPK